ncbi:MAG: hypothetical protein ABI690_31095 [Chloroflexota bacterium]
MSRNALIEFIIISFVALVLLLIAFFSIQPMTYTHPDFNQDWDHHVYIAMAEGISVEAPFAYRVLTPWLASHLPFDLQFNFFLITFLALWGTGIVLYYLIGRWLPDRAQLWGLVGMVAFYSLYWVVGYNLYDFWLSDALNFFLITLAFYAIIAGIDWLFALALLIGAFNREAIIAAIPLYIVFRQLAQRERVKRVILLALPMLGIIICLRLFIHPIDSDYSLVTYFRNYGLTRLVSLPFEMNLYTLAPFGLLFIAPLLTPMASMRLMLKFTPFLLVCYGQLLIANNTERLVALAFPAFIIMSVTALKNSIPLGFQRLMLALSHS